MKKERIGPKRNSRSALFATTVLRLFSRFPASPTHRDFCLSAAEVIQGASETASLNLAALDGLQPLPCTKDKRMTSDVA